MPTADWVTRLHANVQQIRARIADAAARSGRDPATVRLVGVTKYVATDVLRELVAAGVVDIGESRVQQLVQRATERPATDPTLPAADAADADTGPRWHMIGHLQRNKIRQLLPHCRIIHSLDSERLAQALETQAAASDGVVDVLIEVNVAGEDSKQGCSPDEVPRLATRVAAAAHLRLRGLMTMAPYDPDPETARPHFARLRELRDDLRARGLAGPACDHLSMGMSQDYAVAVEEGATLVRVGSALFEGLPSSDPRP